MACDGLLTFVIVEYSANTDPNKVSRSITSYGSYSYCRGVLGVIFTVCELNMVSLKGHQLFILVLEYVPCISRFNLVIRDSVLATRQLQQKVV